MKHIVALSGGKDSTAMALRLAEVEPQDYEYIITPTGNELPDMVLHWKKLGLMLGKPLKPITGGQSLQGLIRRWNALPNWRQRWCTRELKIEPFETYILGLMNEGDEVMAYVGLRADETQGDRKGADYKFEVGQRYPLREWGWGIAEVYTYLEEKGVVIPERTDCAMCFFQTIAEWWRLWRFHPEQYAEAEEYEVMTSHTFRSPGRDTWPADLVGLRQQFERGHEPKGVRQIRLFDSRPTMCSVCAR
jgi:hypothetical protein